MSSHTPHQLARWPRRSLPALAAALALTLASPRAQDAPTAPEAEAPDSAATSHLVPTPAPKLRFHYHRYDGAYDAATLWTWDKRGGAQPEQNELKPAGRDDFGLLFEVDPSLYGADDESDQIGFVIRFHGDWNRKDGTDRTWTTTMGSTVYLIGGQSDMHSERPDVSPKIAAARLDADNRVSLVFSHPIGADALQPGKLSIVDDDGRSYSIADARREGDRRATLLLGESLPFMKRDLTATAEGCQPAKIVPRDVFLDPAVYYDPKAELGATCTAEATTFRVFSPGARKAWVVLYDSYKGDAGRSELEMEAGAHGVWSTTVEGDLHGRYYVYRFEGYRLDPKAEAIDPYARCGSGRHHRGMVVDMRRTDPEGFRPVKRPPMASPNDAVIYEIHVRDFSISSNSGIAAKGKFLGFTEEGTTLPGDTSVKTGVDHLLELGVTHVQLLPIQDFDNDEESPEYNWGYMPSHFNTPDGWYATETYGLERIVEFKKLVRSLHDRGIRVVMDVVYNHTDNSASFNKLAPDYYYRMNENGDFWNGSGTGNEFRTESPMGRKFIVDSCAYWVKEYGIDGFRFDLMGLVDVDTMVALKDAVQEIDPTVIVYGEPWTAGGAGVPKETNKQAVRGTGLGAFNDHFRDAVKGSTDGPEPGFVQTGGRVEGILSGLAGSLTDWSRDPTEAINYVTCHDNLVLWDKIEKSSPGAYRDERVRMHMMALALVLTSQGKAFLHGGTEFLRTKFGEHNSYNKPDSVNQIDWTLKAKNRRVFDYVKGLVAIRREHPVFRLNDRAVVLRRVSFGDTSAAGLVVMGLDGRGVVGETWGLVRVAYNASPKAYSFDLPPGKWNVVVKEDQSGLETIEVVEGRATVGPRSTLMLWQK
jgi:pullulanase